MDAIHGGNGAWSRLRDRSQRVIVARCHHARPRWNPSGSGIRPFHRYRRTVSAASPVGAGTSRTNSTSGSARRAWPRAMIHLFTWSGHHRSGLDRNGVRACRNNSSHSSSAHPSRIWKSTSVTNSSSNAVRAHDVNVSRCHQGFPRCIPSSGGRSRPRSWPSATPRCLAIARRPDTAPGGTPCSSSHSWTELGRHPGWRPR